MGILRKSKKDTIIEGLLGILIPNWSTGATSSTRSTGTLARLLLESNDFCAARAASEKQPSPIGTVTGNSPANHPTLSVSSPGMRVSDGVKP